jgi:hypothetical protein
VFLVFFPFNNFNCVCWVRPIFKFMAPCVDYICCPLLTLPVMYILLSRYF